VILYRKANGGPGSRTQQLTAGSGWKRTDRDGGRYGTTQACEVRAEGSHWSAGLEQEGTDSLGQDDL